MAADPVQRARLGEAALLAFLLFGALVLLAETFRFRTVPWDPLGMAFWPRIQLGLLAAVIVARLWHLRKSVDQDKGGFAQGVGILAACIGFVLGVASLGVYLATPLFFALFGVLRSAENRVRHVITALWAAVIMLLAVWLLFDIALGLRVLSFPYWMR